MVNRPPRIETERLLLRLPEVDDVPRIVAYVSRNRAHFSMATPAHGEEYYTEPFWRRRVEGALQDFAAGRSLVLYLLPRSGVGADEVIGDLTFSNILRGPFQACFLGFKLDEGQVGRGLMYEALRAAVGHAFRELGLHRIMANHLPTNERSARLLQRLGFQTEGLAKDYLFLDGEWRDHVLTALVSPTPGNPHVK